MREKKRQTLGVRKERLKQEESRVWSVKNERRRERKTGKNISDCFKLRLERKKRELRMDGSSYRSFSAERKGERKKRHKTNPKLLGEASFRPTSKEILESSAIVIMIHEWVIKMEKQSRNTKLSWRDKTSDIKHERFFLLLMPSSLLHLIHPRLEGGFIHKIFSLISQIDSRTEIVLHFQQSTVKSSSTFLSCEKTSCFLIHTQTQMSNLRTEDPSIDECQEKRLSESFLHFQELQEGRQEEGRIPCSPRKQVHSWNCCGSQSHQRK